MADNKQEKRPGAFKLCMQNPTGKWSFIIGTIDLIVCFIFTNFGPKDWQYYKICMIVLGGVLVFSGAIFSEVLVQITQAIDAAERKEKQEQIHGKKK